MLTLTFQKLTNYSLVFIVYQFWGSGIMVVLPLMHFPPNFQFPGVEMRRMRRRFTGAKHIIPTCAKIVYLLFIIYYLFIKIVRCHTEVRGNIRRC